MAHNFFVWVLLRLEMLVCVGLVERVLATASLTRMERPPPDPRKLLAHWEEWERGETAPGRVISNLKTGGLRELLEELASEGST